MKKLGEKDATFLSFPPNFQTVENRAFGYAVDRQMSKLMKFVKKISVWSNLDNVDAKYYDFLAASLRAPYYSSAYDDEIRLEILKKTLQTYMFAGTVMAEEELLKNIFSDAQFVPWYKYGGIPFHFKIVTPTEPSEEMIQKFLVILRRVKAQRSIIDGIDTKTYTIDLKAYAALGITGAERLEEADDEL